MKPSSTPEIAVVIPCYQVGARVLDVIARIGPEVGWIHVVDDACPRQTGRLVEQECTDARVQVLYHQVNLGVGGAVLTGYRAALASPAVVVVKLDGDGQMDPALIGRLVAPILSGRADYSKGNRFHHVGNVASMPAVRLIGNAALSFMTKLSSGYWQLFDPTNGFTAIHRSVLAELDFDRIANRYFFESDMLYHLNQLRAVVAEMPMRAFYQDEPSSLRPLRIIGPFLVAHAANFARRLVYGYFLRGFSVASLELLISIPLLMFGTVFGIHAWWQSFSLDEPATAGTVMLAALPLILGSQLFLSWLNFDIASEPRQPVHPLLADRKRA